MKTRKEHKATNAEDKWSSYHKWLRNTNQLYENSFILEYKSFINAFSGFLNLYNPDYHYNETYLSSYFEDFLSNSKKIKIRLKLLEDLIKEESFKELVKQFNKNYSTPSKRNLKHLVINVDNVVTCTINNFSTENNLSIDLINIPNISINSNLDLKGIKNEEFSISYRLKYRDRCNNILFSKEAEEKELFCFYNDIKQELANNVQQNSQFISFKELLNQK